MKTICKDQDPDRKLAYIIDAFTDYNPSPKIKKKQIKEILEIFTSVSEMNGFMAQIKGQKSVLKDEFMGEFGLM